MKRSIRDLLAEPRVTPVPPAGRWHDWLLAVAALVSAVGELMVRDDIVWVPLSAAFGLLMPLVVFWRRVHPFALALALLGATIAVNVASALAGASPVGLNSMAFMLVLPYAVFRWASGKEAAIVLVLMFGVFATGLVSDPMTVGESVGGLIFFFIPAELGAVVRYRERSRVAEVEEMRVRERAQLARELHDTVAHHVSAIAIRAQAGQAVAHADPNAAVDALTIIEREASRTLAEMRRMVGVLRHDEPAELTPQAALADLYRLGDPGGKPSVQVVMSGDLDRMGPSVEAALYRVAQEGVTNALRHARGAQRVDVAVRGTEDRVHLSIRDDGLGGAASSDGTGYGIVGMSERVALLGGTLMAGPRGDGWVVDAELPKGEPQPHPTHTDTTVQGTATSDEAAMSASLSEGAAWEADE